MEGPDTWIAGIYPQNGMAVRRDDHRVPPHGVRDVQRARIRVEAAIPDGHDLEGMAVEMEGMTPVVERVDDQIEYARVFVDDRHLVPESVVQRLEG